MGTSLAPLVLTRRARDASSDWNAAQSWLGGLPRMGALAWPRSDGGRAMTFLAQVDLAEIGRAMGAVLPDATGALAFFAQGTVLHIRDRHDRDTQPPADAPAAFEWGGDLFPEHGSPGSPQTFRRWPLDITAFAADGDGIIDPAAVAARLAPRRYFYDASLAWKTLGDPPHPIFRRTAVLAAEHLRITGTHLVRRRDRLQALAREQQARLDALRPRPALGLFGRRATPSAPDVARAEAALASTQDKLDRIARDLPRYDHLLDTFALWVVGGAPWDELSSADIQSLESMLKQGRSDFASLTASIPRLEEMETEALKDLMVADDAAFGQMPGAMRDLINATCRLPPGAWHQMFGTGVDIQGNAALDQEGDIMLMQLAYDDMMGWRFGDMGVFQFWLSPEDFANGRWERATMTFECA